MGHLGLQEVSEPPNKPTESFVYVYINIYFSAESSTNSHRSLKGARKPEEEEPLT